MLLWSLLYMTFNILKYTFLLDIHLGVQLLSVQVLSFIIYDQTVFQRSFTSSYCTRTLWEFQSLHNLAKTWYYRSIKLAILVIM